jgi:hypothetical protein
MDRRRIITALACWPASRALAQDETPRARHKVSAGELYEALAARFPRRFGAEGLLQLQVGAPRLLLLPRRNKLGAALQVQVAGLRQARGEMDLVFSLRYEPADQTVRAHRPELLDLRLPGLPPEGLAALQALMPTLAREMGEVVLQRLGARELALPETMGLEPEELVVVDDGLLIYFGPKRAR